MHTRSSLSSSPFHHKCSNTPLLITYFISSPHPQLIDRVPSPLFNSCIQLCQLLHQQSCPFHWLTGLPVVLVSSPCQQQNVGRLLWSSFDHLCSPCISLVHIERYLLQFWQANVIKVWCQHIHYTTSHHTITPAHLTCWLLAQHLLSTLPIHIVPTTISQSGAPPPPAHTPPYPPTVGQSLVHQRMPPQWTADLEIISDATSSSYAPHGSPANLPAHQWDVTSQQWQHMITKRMIPFVFCACWTLFQWQPTYSHMPPSPPISSTPNIFCMQFKDPNSSSSCYKKGLFMNVNVLFRVQDRKSVV